MKIENFNEGKEFEPNPTLDEVLTCMRTSREAKHDEDLLAAQVAFAEKVLGRVAPTGGLTLHQLNNAAVDIIVHVFTRSKAGPLEKAATQTS